MILRGKVWTLAAAVVCWLCAAGCATVTMTAANSINPVMFGSTRTLRTGTAPRESSCVAGGTTFHHRESTFGVAVFAGYGGADFGGSSTDLAGDDEGGPDWMAIRARGDVNPVRLDWKVFRLTGENPARRVELTSIRCNGFNSFFLFGIMTYNNCELKGVAPSGE